MSTALTSHLLLVEQLQAAVNTTNLQINSVNITFPNAPKDINAWLECHDDALAQITSSLEVLQVALRHDRNSILTIVSLPHEILAEIFRHMDRRGLIQASHVCSNWRSAAVHSPKLWAIINLSIPEEKVQDALQRSGAVPLHVHQPRHTQGSLQVLSPADRHRVRSMCNITNRLIPSIADEFPNLRFLHIYATRSRHIEDVLGHLPDLIALSILCHPFLHLKLERLPEKKLSLSLRYLDLSGMEATFAVIELISYLPSLQDLSIGCMSTPSITFDGGYPAGTHYPQSLQRLSISGLRLKEAIDFKNIIFDHLMKNEATSIQLHQVDLATLSLLTPVGDGVCIWVDPRRHLIYQRQHSILLLKLQLNSTITWIPTLASLHTVRTLCISISSLDLIVDLNAFNALQELMMTIPLPYLHQNSTKEELQYQQPPHSISWINASFCHSLPLLRYIGIKIEDVVLVTESNAHMQYDAAATSQAANLIYTDILGFLTGWTEVYEKRFPVMEIEDEISRERWEEKRSVLEGFVQTFSVGELSVGTSPPAFPLRLPEAQICPLCEK